MTPKEKRLRAVVAPVPLQTHPGLSHQQTFSQRVHLRRGTDRRIKLLARRTWILSSMNYVEFYIKTASKEADVLLKSIAKVQVAVSTALSEVTAAEAIVKNLPEEEKQMGDVYLKECRRRAKAAEKRLERETKALKELCVGIEAARAQL